MARRNTHERLAPDSLGAIVCPRWSEPREPTARPAPPGLALGSIGALVLGEPSRSPRWGAPLAGLCAAGLVYGLASWAMAKEPRDPPARPRRPLVVIEHEIELDPPPAPEVEEQVAEPAPAPVPTQPPARTVQAPRNAPAPAPNTGPPPPAQAGAVVASEAATDPLDFTGFDMTTGDGPRYAGGVTASAGTNTQAVHSNAVDPDATPTGQQQESSLARSIGLPARNWSCPWPREAEALGIEEQVVVLRAVVSAQGRPSSIEVLADPGHGFGAAAVICARRARFQPARDHRGAAYVATSPPIRVRFTR